MKDDRLKMPIEIKSDEIDDAISGYSLVLDIKLTNNEIIILGHRRPLELCFRSMHIHNVKGRTFSEAVEKFKAKVDCKSWERVHKPTGVLLLLSFDADIGQLRRDELLKEVMNFSVSAIAVAETMIERKWNVAVLIK